MLIVGASICGFIFGWGLLISSMVQPAKVLAFLDIFGPWDPSLAIVMASALVVSSAGFALAKSEDQRPAEGEFPLLLVDFDLDQLAGARVVRFADDVGDRNAVVRGNTAASPMRVMNSRRFTAQRLPCFRPKG
jgi:Family of unknown function (DUF6691)